jgi:hypothetical protein
MTTATQPPSEFAAAHGCISAVEIHDPLPQQAAVSSSDIVSALVLLGLNGDKIFERIRGDMERGLVNEAREHLHFVDTMMKCAAASDQLRLSGDKLKTKMNDQLPATPDEARAGEPLAASGLLDALERFLDNHGSDFLSWRDGCIVVETYYDKKFRALGGDTSRLISFFEDYGNASEAARHYLSALRKAVTDSA